LRRDLKSLGLARTGSTPVVRTTFRSGLPDVAKTGLRSP
jgi:hypothetical protein